jgi:hypothetical protein
MLCPLPDFLLRMRSCSRFVDECSKDEKRWRRDGLVLDASCWARKAKPRAVPARPSSRPCTPRSSHTNTRSSSTESGRRLSVSLVAIIVWFQVWALYALKLAHGCNALGHAVIHPVLTLGSWKVVEVDLIRNHVRSKMDRSRKDCGGRLCISHSAFAVRLSTDSVEYIVVL